MVSLLNEVTHRGHSQRRPTLSFCCLCGSSMPQYGHEIMMSTTRGVGILIMDRGLIVTKDQSREVPSRRYRALPCATLSWKNL